MNLFKVTMKFFLIKNKQACKQIQSSEANFIILNQMFRFLGSTI